MKKPAKKTTARVTTPKLATSWLSHPALNTVTPLSKGLAMVLFVVLPFLAFMLGMYYQRALTFCM